MGAIRRMLGLSESKAEVLERELAVTRENAAFAIESGMASLELALDDTGWERLTGSAVNEFSREGLRRSAEICRVMAVGNPLIKRGLAVRQAYVWGQGVQFQARATGQDGEQDVNAVVQAFLTDPGNRAAFTGDQAQEEAERVLGTDGNHFLACFTNPRTGFVQVRAVPFDEITDIITNPDDRDDPWFYRRQWTQTTLGDDGRTRTESRTAYYPALMHRPRVRLYYIDGHPVMWDAPIHHTSVNRLDGWLFGIGDAYAAVAFARAYRDFLSDWATLVKALSQFAFQLSTGKPSRAQRMRQDLARAAVGTPGNPNSVGATVAVAEGTRLEAIPKTGATVDSESGRPLAAMVAAALDVPVTTLLADPGQTGARAVAETLALPTRLAMQQRQSLWGETYRAVLQYVITAAVRAPQGPLRGTIVRDPFTGREQLALDGDTDTTIEITWPSLEETPLATIVDAIVKADGTGKLPPIETLKLLLHALSVKDIDEIIDQVTDDDGAWLDPYAQVGQTVANAAIQAFRRGEDPSAAVR